MSNKGFMLILAIVGVASAQEAVPHSGTSAWVSREALPAVVNPVMRSPLQEVVSLRGDWEFTTDPQTNGLAAGWMRPGVGWPNQRTLQVPGCWEAQGVGEPGISQPWDMNDRGPYPLRHVYMGSAWYRRMVPVPAAWRDKRIWLKIGGVRSQGWFWVNGKSVAHDYSYCSVTKYDITDCVTPGQDAAVVVLARNDVPSRKGSAGWRHRAGGLYRDVEIEATPETWLDNVWVRGDFDKREAVVHTTVAYATEAGRLKSPAVHVRITHWNGGTASVPSAADTEVRPPLGKTGVKSGKIGVVGIGSAAIAFAKDNKETQVEVRVPLEPFMPWSPEHPNLYVAEVTLCDGDTPVHGWTERFGVRKLEVRGDRFFLNDKPFFVRGYGDDHIYPITLISPASREDHLKRLTIARESGFNYVRLHTHCEVPEFYEAADEVGILVQAELPYNHAAPGEAFPSDPKRDLRELITHYQRYVSLATCCMGNEGGFPSPLDNALYALSKSLNPQLLVLHHDGGSNTPENSDFRTGPINPWTSGAFASAVPFVAHEYLNLSVKADPRLDASFTGLYLPSLDSLGLGKDGMEKVRAGLPRHMSDLDSAPRDLRSFEAELNRLQLSRAWGDACVDAGHALQRYGQKQGVEAARLDPACDGYSFWTIVDVLYQAQGLFNVFWEPKSGGATPEEFRVFNGPTAILKRAGGQSPVVVSGQTLTNALWISHSGEEDLKKTKLVWKVCADKMVLASGSLETGDVVVGGVRELGVCSFTVPPLSKPVHAVLEAELITSDNGVAPVPPADAKEGFPPSVCNTWDFWFFPKREAKDGGGMAATRRLYSSLAKRFPGLARSGTPEGDAASVLIASDGDPEALAALGGGRKVVLLDRCGAPDNTHLGWWLLGNQTGTAMARHPAFGDFPHDGFLSPLWSRMVKRPELLQPDDGFCGAEPLMVGDGIHGYSLYLCQSKVGKGKMLRACGLDVLTDTPEGTCLLDALLGYARSEAFAPKTVLDEGRLAERWRRHQQIFNGLNGWAHTLNSDDARSGRHFFGTAKSRHLNLPKGKTKKLEWETLPVPADEVGKTATFRWLQVTSVSEWGTKIAKPVTVILDGKTVLTYTAGILNKEWTVREGDAALVFTGLDFTQNSMTGVMELIVPRSWVNPGTPCVIRLAAEPDGKGDLSTGVIEVNTATFRPPRIPNGWLKTLCAGDSGRNKLPSGVGQLDVARAMKGENELVWETFPAPGNVRENPAYTFEWRGGMGYFAEPQGSFVLYVNDEKVIDIPEISEKDAEWFSSDKAVRLKYARDNQTAEYGMLTLTLPSSKVTPGKSVLLKVVGSESNSHRWFGVFQIW